MYSYIFFNPWYSKTTPIRCFNDYHEAIMFIRRNKIDDWPIWMVTTNDWNADSSEVGARLYLDAWNGFDHYTDRNY